MPTWIRISLWVALAAVRVNAAGLTDCLSLADQQQRKDHEFASRGDVRFQTVGDRLGGHDMRALACIVSGDDSSIEFRLKVAPSQPITLEFEQIHGREVDVIGYEVLVDGARRHFRTWEGCGAGPVHFFVDLPPVDRDHILVRLVSRCVAAWAIGRIWAFADFDRFFEQARLDIPFHIAPTVHLRWTDIDADIQRVRQIADSLGDHPNVRPAWTTWIGYANLADELLRQRIDYALTVAERSRLPVQLALDTWWAHTPSGPDGQGGTWRDQKHQQVVYNVTQRRFQLSTPNMWGNTPWLTINDPDLNAFKARRLKVAARLLAEHPKNSHILAVNLDNEPVYWASGNAGLGPDLLWADFHPAAIADARSDGVKLDPADGLGASERAWLLRNLLRYNSITASAAAQGLAGSRLRHDVYTQAMVANPAIQYPMMSQAHPFWEGAAPAEARVGGEWNRDSMHEVRAVLHQIALGRTAAVNAECGNDAAMNQAVRPAYALGQRFIALYNYPLDKLDVAGCEIRDVATRFRTQICRRILLDQWFVNDAWKKRAASHADVQTALIGNTAAVAISPTSSRAPGVLTYRVPADSGLSLEFSGRAFVHRGKNPAVRIRILAGASEDAMNEVFRMSDLEDIHAMHRVELSSPATGPKMLMVRIELHAAGLPREALNWVCIYHLRFCAPWPKDLEQSADDSAPARTWRRRSLLVSWRRDAELLLPGADPGAMAAYQRGDYAAVVGSRK